MSENQMKTRWMGHSTWELTTSTGKTIVVDPWYTDNPKNSSSSANVKADYVLITHDHWDHVKDVPVLVQNGAKVVTQPEVVKRFVQDHELPDEAFIRINMGGTVTLEEGIHVTLFQAFHSSDSGNPGGLIIRDGDVTIMNTGDTSLHGDLQLYGELYPPTLLMLPIGDRFTMGIRDAAKAVSMIKPEFCVPMHYSTFPAIEQDPSQFEKEVNKLIPEVSCWLPNPGQEKAWSTNEKKTSVK
ncbi:metal-dependent hydrolase [Aquibacillus saliphilus]|uniref:metal-dependent hydrolase n=1 Tax=Aquibacillus saliphilus TaxID=1909422 RepID=UPI001CF08739|nr:metal-dependent hydrolase [Aquibacillus saliphilus]